MQYTAWITTADRMMRQRMVPFNLLRQLDRHNPFAEISLKSWGVNSSRFGASFATSTSAKTRQSSMVLKLSLNNKVTVITGRMIFNCKLYTSFDFCSPSFTATGGARGIGFELAKSTADLGSDIALMDIREPETDLLELEKKYGTKFKFYQYDPNYETLRYPFSARDDANST